MKRVLSIIEQVSIGSDLVPLSSQRAFGNAGGIFGFHSCGAGVLQQCSR